MSGQYSTISTNDFIQSRRLCIWLLDCTKSRRKTDFDCLLWIKMDRKRFHFEKKEKKNRISNAVTCIELDWIEVDWNDGSQTAKRRKIAFLCQVINSENWIYFSPSVFHSVYYDCVPRVKGGGWKKNTVDILFICSKVGRRSSGHLFQFCSNHTCESLIHHRNSKQKKEGRKPNYTLTRVNYSVEFKLRIFPKIIIAKWFHDLLAFSFALCGFRQYSHFN